MRKVTLLAAAVFAAVLSTTPNIATAAAAKQDPAVAAQQNTNKLFQDAVNPYMATSKAATAPKAKKKKVAKKK